MLTNTTPTRGSERMSSKLVFMVSDVAFPPVSRKFAEAVEKGGAERREESASLVLRARPAPLTSVPIRGRGWD